MKGPISLGEYIDSIADPDEVGTTEFRLVHELLVCCNEADVGSVAPEREKIDLALGALNQLILTAADVSANLQRVAINEAFINPTSQ